MESKLPINKIALFLSGKLPPYYGWCYKFAFIEQIERFAPEKFSDSFFERVQKYTPDNESFFAECIISLEKYDQQACKEFLLSINLPESLRNEILSKI